MKNFILLVVLFSLSTFAADVPDAALIQYELTSEWSSYKYTYRGFKFNNQSELIGYISADKLLLEQEYAKAWDVIKNFSKTSAIVKAIISEILNGTLEKKAFPLAKKILDECLIKEGKYDSSFKQIAVQYSKLNGSSIEAIFPLNAPVKNISNSEEIDVLRRMIVELQKQNASLSQRVEILEQQIKK